MFFVNGQGWPAQQIIKNALVSQTFHLQRKVAFLRINSRATFILEKVNLYFELPN